ncbi:hypothetical protein ARMGADRAFT_1093244 [Armillaria gallica]|uniref:Uncharacterized protein n=1 Tax=Armillaria gallica TaxID=47427 RepID=A0A2H3CJG1_ARMGA|nr:hypothetical protein ARMGADRAFT_1093244 [Armillaria gallica]
MVFIEEHLECYLEKKNSSSRVQRSTDNEGTETMNGVGDTADEDLTAQPSGQNDEQEDCNSVRRPDLPKNAPKWAVDSLVVFDRECALPEFGRLINLWIRFEIKEGFANSSKFGAASRPPAIHDWIA